MKRSSLLYVVAAVLFAIAAVISFMNENGANGAVAALLAMSMLLAAIHYRRKGL